MSKLLRAVAEDDKELRRRSILAAAEKLFADDSSQLPSVISIAQACGLAKGTVYLYFKTKEEIFLALLAEHFERWFEQGMAEIQQMKAEGCTELEVQMERLLASLMDYVQEHQDFLRLASMSHSVIEKNLNDDTAYNFKKVLLEQLTEIGQAIEELVPILPKGEGALLLRRTYALTIGIWQMSDWPEAMVKSLGTEEFEVLRPKFSEEIQRAVKQLWLGAAHLG